LIERRIPRVAFVAAVGAPFAHRLVLRLGRLKKPSDQRYSQADPNQPPQMHRILLSFEIRRAFISRRDSTAVPQAGGGDRQ
jgi:hypothetical protein